MSRLQINFPNCKLDDLIPYVTDLQKKQEYDDSFEVIKFIKKFPLNTDTVYAKMKTMWPVGTRDFLTNQQMVRFQDQVWIHNFSVEDEDYPEEAGLTRVKVESFMIYLKPNPEIRGYTLITMNEYHFGGNLPNSIILSNAIPKGAKTWQKLQSIIQKNKRDQI